MNLKISNLIESQIGELYQGSLDSVLSYLSTDTRKINKGDYYLALRGENFDGHDFLKEALDSGAEGFIIESGRINLLENLKSSIQDKNIITVDDTLKALGDIAHLWREKFEIPIIGITGSSGKTTTKDMLKLCLQHKSVCHTIGNFNNLVGLPLSLMQLNSSHEIGIFEMGMNAFGEISRLTEILEPTIGLITNVGRAHLEGVGSIEGVAKAKSELFLKLKENHIAIINKEDSFIPKFETKAKKITYGYDEESDLKLKIIKSDPKKSEIEIRTPEKVILFHLPFSSPFMIQNFLSVYAICYLLEIDSEIIQKNISQYQSSDMRGESLEVKDGMIIINDAYNANPDSMRASLKSVDIQYKNSRKIAFLGEMHELGSHAESLHQELGEMTAQLDFEGLFSVGSHSNLVKKGFEKNSKKSVFVDKDLESLKEDFLNFIQPNDVILIKGSRKNKLERILDWLK